MRLATGSAIGWGEAAPRSYVTGETARHVLRDLTAVDYRRLSAAIDWAGFDAAVHSLAARPLTDMTGCRQLGPAASAALEGALLDVICRRWQRTFGEAFEQAGLRFRPREPTAALHFSTVLDLSRDPLRFVGAMDAQQRAALRFVKVKASRDPRATLATVRELTQLLPVRTGLAVDVNGMWTADVVLDTAPSLADAGVSWLEEPTGPRQWDVLREVRQRADIGIMLDESFSGADDIHRASREEAATHVNLRVSKCGGPLGALRMAALARAHGLQYQVGVHVGEVGPLWACGRHVAGALGDAVAVEAGRQDEWFPAPLTEPAYTVDRQRHRVHQLPGPGCGVVPSAKLLSYFRPEFVLES
ncbi:enolase C-terminal domain-like protein [Streptomyces sp. NPDC047117]|uniref:enolase C-terminal domain-like protein n=1 Tax=Streptomyces sp. NPDC047117 TaxID=3155379 RepID=UPI003402B1DE